MQRPHARSRLKRELDRSEMDPRPGNQSPLTHRLAAKSKSKQTKWIIMLIIAFIAMALGLVFILRFAIFSRKNGRGSLRYSVVVDGGSSGTRIHVFGYLIESGKPVFDFGAKNYASLKLSPGLSSYDDNPDGASLSMTELVEFAKRRVPKGMLKETEIRLMATAGMRLLELPVQEQILEVTRKVLRSSGFKFQDDWASVISGSDEGIYAWVIANHALGALGGDPLQTTGIVELGGASAQVTFVSSERVPREYSRTISYGNMSYNLYTHSFLHLGQDAAHEKLWESLNSTANSTQKGKVIDPCAPKGYYTNSQNSSSLSMADEIQFPSSLQAGGNYSQCRSASLAILQEGKEKCQYKHCFIGSTFTPNLRGSFLATENFFHTSNFFGLDQNDWLSEMISAGEKHCGEEWSKLKVKYPKFSDENILRYCFSSAYIISMLHDSLGFALHNQRIEFANKARDIPLDWALGAYILNTAANISDYIGRSRKII